MNYLRPMITILMAHYDQKAYIKKSIKSVLTQNNPNWRLIICDDSSQEDILPYIEYLIKDPRIRFIRNKENLGYVATLKKMISEAETEIVGILDADDALTKNAVDLVLQAYQKNPEIGFTYSDLYICDTLLIPRRLKVSRQIDGRVSALHKFYVDHFRTFKREVYYKTGGYDQKYIYAEDQDISYKLEETAPGFHINKALYFYRILPFSQSRQSTKRARGILSHILAMIEARKRRQNTDIPTISDIEFQKRIAEFRRFNPRIFPGPRKDPWGHTYAFLRYYLTLGFKYRLADAKYYLSRLIHIASGKSKALIKRIFTFDEQANHQVISSPPVISMLCKKKQFAFLRIPGNQLEFLMSLVFELDWGVCLKSSEPMIDDLAGDKIDGELNISCSDMEGLPKDYIKFAVYQDPLERALRFYKNRIYLRKGFYRFTQNIAEKNRKLFDKFINSLHSDCHPARRNLQLLSQFCMVKNIDIDFLVPVNSLSDFLAEQFAIDGRTPDSCIDPSSEAFMLGVQDCQIEMIKTIFKEDYDMLEVYKDKLYKNKGERK